MIVVLGLSVGLPKFAALARHAAAISFESEIRHSWHEGKEEVVVFILLFFSPD